MGVGDNDGDRDRGGRIGVLLVVLLLLLLLVCCLTASATFLRRFPAAAEATLTQLSRLAAASSAPKVMALTGRGLGLTMVSSGNCLAGELWGLDEHRGDRLAASNEL